MRPLCPALLHLPIVLLGLAARPALAGEDPALGVLHRSCLPCHGADPARLRGGLDLRTREAATRGGASGALALVPGKPGESLIYQAVSGAPDVSAMPPEDQAPLAPGEAELLRAWIARGAPWPSQGPEPARAGVRVWTSGGQSTAWDQRPYDAKDLWAFVPLRPASTPPSSHPVDHFLSQRLRVAGIDGFAPPAGRRALIRRATFDLLGLPPNHRDVDAFLRDDGPGAYERLLDRLLRSPHYGEQQARHWLDVARYADTAGMANDFELPNAWRYRDYVIRSFNRDTPFDRFVLEQVAGDELAPDDPLMKVAVGFLRMGPWERGWDSHDDLPRSHGARIHAIDRPLAGLIKDLRARGLLDSTLLVWAGEFGRSPDNGVREGKSVPGRDHNAKAMALWLAGGGSRAGAVVGATDEVGGEAVEVARPLRDLHVTILHLMGLDDGRLTYLHEGRWKQLSQVGGKVIRELVAG